VPCPSEEPSDRRNPNAKRLRVLVLADNCNPEWESTPMVGWQHSRALARIADVHIVTTHWNAENIAKAGLIEGVDFTAIDTAAVGGRAERVLTRLGFSWQTNRGWTIQAAVNAFSYPWFEHLAWKQFGEAIRGGAFDIVQRIMPMSPVVPSPMARRCRTAGVPFVLGPLNGGLPWPRQFNDLRNKEREWLSAVRDAYKAVPGYRSTRENASAILVASRATDAEVPARYHDKCVYIPEYAVDPAKFTRYEPRRYDLPLHLVFVGRFVPLKCVDVLVEAAAPLVRSGAIRITLVGDGSEIDALRDLVRREEIVDDVTFTGWIKHQDLQDILATAHLFGFPSIKDLGAGAATEAMAMGVVPIVVDYGGPGELVSPSTGFRVPLGTRSELVAGVRRALEHAVASPNSLGPMAERARERVLRLFTWDAKASQVLEVYRWILGERDKPDFGMPFDDPDDAAEPDA
jgi:alpha-maltose-1-phosphate synthase